MALIRKSKKATRHNRVAMEKGQATSYQGTMTAPASKLIRLVSVAMNPLVCEEIAFLLALKDPIVPVVTEIGFTPFGSSAMAKPIFFWDEIRQKLAES